MSAAGQELHAGLPGARPNSPGSPAAPASWRPHGRALGAQSLPSAGEASQPEERRSGGLARPGSCEGGPRAGTLAAKGGRGVAERTSGGRRRPEEKEFPLIQKERGCISSPSHTEIKGLPQNLEENPAKVQVAPEIQSSLMKEAPGMKADGTRLCCKTGECSARVRTGVVPEASQCSGGETVMARIAVSGTDSSVPQEPLSPATTGEEEECKGHSAWARQAGEETIQNRGQEINAIFNNHPSVQQDKLSMCSNNSLALALDACLPGMGCEASGHTFQSSSEFGKSPRDRTDLSEVACEMQKESLKNNLSRDKVEVLEEWASELNRDKALLQSGSTERELPSNEDTKQHRDVSMDPSYSCALEGTMEIQKQSAVQCCQKPFCSEHGRFPIPAQQLPMSKGAHSEFGTCSLSDAVHAPFEEHLEDDLKLGSSEAGRIQEDNCYFLHHERWIAIAKENQTLLWKGNKFGCFQNNCSINIPLLHSYWDHHPDFGENGLPQVEAKSDLGAAILIWDLPLPLRAIDSSSVRDVSLFADKKSFQIPQLWDRLPLTKKANTRLGHGVNLSPKGVVVMQNFSPSLCHKKAFASSQNRGRGATVKAGTWEVARRMPGRAEKEKPGMETLWRSAFHSSQQSMGELSSATEEFQARSRGLFLGYQDSLQKERRGTATKISYRLGISPAPFVSSGKFPCLSKCYVILCNCSACGNNGAFLERPKYPVDSVYSLDGPCSILSEAEAGNWRVDGGDAFDNPEGILDGNSNIFPPSVRVKVNKAAFGADAGEMKTMESIILYNNPLKPSPFLQLAPDGNLSKALHSCEARFGKYQNLEEQEEFQIHPFSSAPNLSDLKQKDSTLCTQDSAQQRESFYQIKILIYPRYFLDSCTLFEEKKDSSEREFLQCRQRSLIFYKKVSYHDLQTLISSAVKYIRCNKNKSLPSKIAHNVIPPATALLTEYYQNIFQQNTPGEESSNNMGSELTGNELKEDSEESQRTLLGCLECASELLNQNSFVRDEAPQSNTAELNSISESVNRSSSEKFNFKNGLLSDIKLASSPKQTSFQTGPTISAMIIGQKSVEGLHLKYCRKRGMSSLISVGLGLPSQNKKKCFSPKDEVLPSSSLKAHGSPLAKERILVTLVLQREDNCHVRPFGLETERAGCSIRQDAFVDCPLGSKEISWCIGGAKQGSGGEGGGMVFLSNTLDQRLEAEERAGGQAAWMTEFPIPILSDAEESSEAILEDGTFPLRGGTVSFSLRDAAYTRLPVCFPEDILEFDSSKAKDSSEPTITQQHAENRSDALQAKPLFSRKPAEQRSSLEEGMLKSSSRQLRSEEGRSLSCRELAGGPGKVLGGPSVDKSIRRRDSEAAAQPPKEMPKMERRLAIGLPLASFLDENAGKLEDPGQRAFASVRGVVQKRKQESPVHTVTESKRPKRGQGCRETTGLNLAFRSCSHQAKRWPNSVPAFAMLPPTVGCHQSRSPNALGRSRQGGPGAACTKVCVPSRLRASEKRLLTSSSPFLKEPPEVAPGQKGELVYSAQFATKPLAPHVPWDQPAKAQGYPSSSPASFWLSGHAKDVALLRRLCMLAEKLLGPKGKPLLHCGVLLPSAPASSSSSQLRRKKLLEIFSFVSLKLNSPQSLNGSSCCFKMGGSEAVPVYSIESTILCFFELSSEGPCLCSTPLFPVPFHSQTDTSPNRRLPTTGPPGALSRLARQASGCCLSFLLHRSCPSITPIQKDAEPSPLPASARVAKAEGRRAVAQSMGSPICGLPTALALFSPGCYRIWTRKRHLSSRIPSVERLTLLQFTRGLKGFTHSTSVSADLFSSLPYSLGRVLSIWSQHSPSIRLSEFTPLHSSPCKGQPASLSVPPLVPGPRSDTSRAVHNDMRLEPFLSLLLPTSCSAPGAARCPPGFPALGSGDKHDASIPPLPKARTQLEKDESEKRPKKVSQIRIRKTIPKPDPNLTPMGLPRPKRLKKTEFSLEEIYTNKNYKSPPTTRCLETIFEEPKEKNGSLISVSQQKRKRILEFQDFTIPRKRKARSRVRATGGYTRAQKAAIEGRELDILLMQKLTDLETFFAKEEKQGQALGS